MLNIELAYTLPVQLSETSEFYIRNNRFKPEKKQFFKFLIDYCDQALSDNL